MLSKKSCSRNKNIYDDTPIYTKHLVILYDRILLAET